MTNLPGTALPRLGTSGASRNKTWSSSLSEPRSEGSNKRLFDPYSLVTLLSVVQSDVSVDQRNLSRHLTDRYGASVTSKGSHQRGGEKEEGSPITSELIFRKRREVGEIVIICRLAGRLPRQVCTGGESGKIIGVSG